ncbi:MAG: NAD-dependent epimerase/dehydratase family protein, partial [Ignavibacteriales bacterium]|nr:NAD-dependent epimerase/dehydratase family protein [Ignavibacteriales bacterium]
VLVRELLAQGYAVRVLDNLIYGHGASIAALSDHPSFSFVLGDLVRGLKRNGVLREITDVVLLAGLVGDPICRTYRKTAQEVNEQGSISLFEELYGRGINRFIFASTCSNYGLKPDDSMATEASELNPQSLYAECKVAVEQHILGRAGAIDFCPTILRIATAYGLSHRMRFDLTVSEFSRELALRHPLTVYDENTWRPYCHVRDISAAIIRVLESEKDVVDGEVFNVGCNQENYTKKMIVSAITETVGHAEVNYKEGGVDPRNYRVSFDKIKSVLGFEPSFTIQSYIPRIVGAVQVGLYSDVEDRREFYGNYAIRS